MRLRNIPGAREEIAASPFVIQENIMREKKGHWDAAFDRAQPLYLEIGMGKGRFITETALRHSDRNYIGIEKYSSVLVRALEKRQHQEDLT
ncbi:MAG: tRNA (guanosine(46)-N7)-methyltransferase TrmB, partial [Clostridiales bacterium]|nr:tRNA (guanosine(46)-N7)-methyltransferase TrmB [Clostridiales bacterium]